MKRKKRGSSIITVTIIFAILMILGFAMLSMTLQDYRMRINESARIENLYASQSGQDVAKNILTNAFDSACKFGILGVNELKKVEKNDKGKYESKGDSKSIYMEEYIHCLEEIDKINKSKDKNASYEIKKYKEEIRKIYNKEFKRRFKDFIYVDDSSSNISNEYKPSLLKSLINDEKIVSEIISLSKIDLSDVTSDINYKLYIADNGIRFVDKVTRDDEKDQESGKYEIRIRSDFETDTSTIVDKNIGQNKKTIETSYEITIPNYDDIACSESDGAIKEIPVLNKKSLVIGKNLNVNDSDNLEINSDIYVCGSLDSNKKIGRSYSKYFGGINLTSSNNAKFNGDVITPRTFNIRENVNSTISGNLYAKNIYAGKESGLDGASNSKLSIETQAEKNKGGQAIIDNDIAVKSTDSNIIIDELYGINEKNINDEELAVTSSSILVNGNYSTSVRINKIAYIMGVANIDTNPGYVTGESVGVKGNYIAYAKFNDTDENKSDYKFKNYDPLWLIDSNSVQDKSELFQEYWKNKLDKINTGGIILPQTTYAVGAIVYKDENNDAKLLDGKIIDTPSKVQEMRNKYAENVYSIVPDASQKYTPLKNVDSNNIFNSIMDLDNLKTNNYDINNEISNEEKAIFNDDKNKKIVLEKDNTLTKSYKINTEGNRITIKTKEGKLNAIIVTSGDVEIKSDISFKGAIIAKGNLTIDSADDVSIEHDENLIKRIQAAHEELFEDIFINTGSINSSSRDSNSNIEVSYDLYKFFKTTLWRIVK